jgi:hypothetical protein
LSHNDCSNGEVSGLGEPRGRSAARLSRVIVLSLALVGVGAASAHAQTPSTPSTDPAQQQAPAGQQTPQPGQTQEQSQQPTPSPTTPSEQPQIPLFQQYPIQQPGRPPITPGTPPSTTLPPWTPPVPPAPSQTNIPAPLPIPVPGAPGLPGTPGYVGIPNLTLPGAFAPTIATVRGATLEFHPTARVSEEYSDNFFQTSSHAEDNFRSTLGPGFVILLNGARTFGTLYTTLDLVHDTAKDSGDDVKVFPSINAAVRYLFTPRLSLTLTETFIRNDAPNVVDQFGLRRGRQIYDTNTLGATVDWLLGRIATQAYYRNVLFFNEGRSAGSNTVGGGANQSDQVTNILGVNASTRIAVDYLVRAGYEFSRTDQQNGNSTGGDNTSHTVFAAASRLFGLYTTGGLSTSAQFQSQNSTRIYNASLFGAYGLPSGLSLSAAVGYSILDSDTQNAEGTVSANVTAGYRFNRAFFSVGVFQDFQQTSQQGQNFGTVETRSYFGSFLYQWTPFINTTLHVTYSENAPTGSGNQKAGGSQNTLNYGASLNYQILRWLTASLQYNYRHQTGGSAFGNTQVGQFGGGDFSENRATLSLFATF